MLLQVSLPFYRDRDDEVEPANAFTALQCAAHPPIMTL